MTALLNSRGIPIALGTDQAILSARPEPGTPGELALTHYRPRIEATLQSAVRLFESLDLSSPGSYVGDPTSRREIENTLKALKTISPAWFATYPEESMTLWKNAVAFRAFPTKETQIEAIQLLGTLADAFTHSPLQRAEIDPHTDLQMHHHYKFLMNHFLSEPNEEIRAAILDATKGFPTSVVQWDSRHLVEILLTFKDASPPFCDRAIEYLKSSYDRVDARTKGLMEFTVLSLMSRRPEETGAGHGYSNTAQPDAWSEVRSHAFQAAVDFNSIELTTVIVEGAINTLAFREVRSAGTDESYLVYHLNLKQVNRILEPLGFKASVSTETGFYDVIDTTPSRRAEAA